MHIVTLAKKRAIRHNHRLVAVFSDNLMRIFIVGGQGTEEGKVFPQWESLKGLPT